MDHTTGCQSPCSSGSQLNVLVLLPLAIYSWGSAIPLLQLNQTGFCFWRVENNAQLDNATPGLPTSSSSKTTSCLGVQRSCFPECIGRAAGRQLAPPSPKGSRHCQPDGGSSVGVCRAVWWRLSKAHPKILRAIPTVRRCWEDVPESRYLPVTGRPPA